MKPSPLQLERYFFSKIELNAHTDADSKAEHTLQCGVEIGEAVDNPQRFQVTLQLKLLAPEKTRAQYTGEFHAVGFFRVVDSWPKEQTMQLVETNGPAMLYSALREMIYTLTARGPWPAVTLKSVTFLNSSEESKIKELKATLAAKANKQRLQRAGGKK
jgi:preprotein translocase subunit SecB